MASSHVGSMDVMVTKKLATQLEALLPPTATELPLSHNTQVGDSFSALPKMDNTKAFDFHDDTFI